ncbi:MAG: tetraacyldisaccharide 4-kinase [Francisellaceae bacterium]|nr:tetraacyldisaccharide 4-kinase [Francisellaceae bacterium]
MTLLKIPNQIKNHLKNYFFKIWYDSSLAPPFFLILLNYIYKAIIFCRKKLYAYRFLKTIHFKQPVIIVGNITVGGTGKTSLVIYLANYLQSKKYKVGIVSRGYHKNKQGVFFVDKQDLAYSCGDEPLLIAKNTHCPVVVGNNRVKAVEYLLNTHNVDIIIGDDGLQHYALGRSLEMVLMDETLLLGNGYCLPAGPLREPKSCLDNIIFKIIKGKIKTSGYLMQYQMADQVVSIFNSTIKYSIKDLMGSTVHVLAGIANPQSFFESFKEKGIRTIEHLFSDHYNYTLSDIVFEDENRIIMTEKDAVKIKDLWGKQDVEQSILKKYYYWPIHIILDENFDKDLDRFLENKLN